MSVTVNVHARRQMDWQLYSKLAILCTNCLLSTIYGRIHGLQASVDPSLDEQLINRNPKQAAGRSAIVNIGIF